MAPGTEQPAAKGLLALTWTGAEEPEWGGFAGPVTVQEAATSATQRQRRMLKAQ
jgi:hypothetical protein